jgi:hypothetical protein
MEESLHPGLPKDDKGSQVGLPFLYHIDCVLSNCNRLQLEIKIILALVRFIPAGTAKAADYHVLEVRLKTVFLSQGFLDGQEYILGTLLGTAAATANQVMVMPFFRMMIDKMVAGLAFQNTSSLLQQLQGPVNGGLIHAGHLFLDAIDDFLSGQMGAGIMDDIHNQAALRSEPHPFFF